MPGRFFDLAALLLLVLMALLAGGAARHESVTFDEVAHTGAGVSYLQKLDMRMNEEHPPLAKVMAALPLVLRGVQANYSHFSWSFSSKFFYQYLGEWVFGDWLLLHWNDPHSTISWARAPMLVITLLLGLTLYIYGSRLGGLWGGLLCLSVFVTTPAFIAFGPLVITDIPVTLFWVLTVWQLPNMWRAPNSGTVVRFGLALAGALLSKFSAGLLFIVFMTFALSLRLRPLSGQPDEKAELRRWRRQGWRNVIKGTFLAAFFIYIVYLVLSWNQPTDSFDVIPHFSTSPLLRRLLMPPWLYLRGLAGFAITAGSRPTYILGHAYSHGVWFYFPVLFVLKSQLTSLLLLLVAVISAFLVKGPAIPTDLELNWRSAWVSLVVFVAACMLNRLDISIRHFSIALALVALLVAPLPRLLELLGDSRPRLATVGTWLTVTLATASVVVAIRIYPNYFPYVNSLGMGRPAYTLVNDSNVDWNHALPQVETWVRARGLKQILLDEYGFSEATPYITQATQWNCQQPTANDGGLWAVVSANYIAESRNCGWLMSYPHETLAGGSMFAFELPLIIPAAGEDGGPPLPANYRYLGGNKDFDPLIIFGTCVRDPQQLQPTVDHFQAMMQEQAKKK
jgi:hypothetical protein